MATKRTSASNRKSAPVAESPSFGERLRATFTWIVLLCALAAIGYLFVRNGAGFAAIALPLPTVPAPAVATTSQPNAQPQANSAEAIDAQTDPAKRIGLVSGHRGNDTGTICADGLTEASVNFDHATRTADTLRAAGYQVDILDEKDERLKNYEALAFVSIHADSCAYINDQATGYKVARSIHSAVPQIEDRLVSCLTSRYAQATGMRFHRNTVTHNMTEYHGFYKIGAKTPSAIIETGFMNRDRDMLTKRADVVAAGISNGILCFLRDETP
jgi:N-acetylmuramoyl-L-alanine amidase